MQFSQRPEKHKLDELSGHTKLVDALREAALSCVCVCVRPLQCSVCGHEKIYRKCEMIVCLTVWGIKNMPFSMELVDSVSC